MADGTDDGAGFVALTVVNCADSAAPGWRFLEAELHNLGTDLRWRFHDGNAKNWLERTIRQPRLSRYRACWNAVRDAGRHQPAVIISHLPRTSCWVAVFCWILSVRAEHIAFAFNFTDLPGRAMRTIMSRALRNVTRFVVYSEGERVLYANFFSLPIDRFDFLPWAMDVPIPSPRAPLIDGRYVCAVGSEGRDVETLFAVARRLPEIPFVVVSRLVDPDLPAPENVRTFRHLPPAQCWNVLGASELSIVPLDRDTTNCGHITVVASHLLRRPVVATRTIGLEGYVVDGVNGRSVSAGDADELRRAVLELWADPTRARDMGERGHDRADTENRVDVWVDYIRDQLSLTAHADSPISRSPV